MDVDVLLWTWQLSMAPNLDNTGVLQSLHQPPLGLYLWAMCGEGMQSSGLQCVPFCTQ